MNAQSVAGLKTDNQKLFSDAFSRGNYRSFFKKGDKWRDRLAQGIAQRPRWE